MGTVADVSVIPVTEGNWRDVRALQVAEDQRAFVEEPNFYLALCCYTVWNPCAIVADD